MLLTGREMSTPKTADLVTPDFPVPVRIKPPPTVLAWASRVLNEALMGFLALVALATAMAPLVFETSKATDHIFGIIEWIVVGLFVAEFVVRFAVAEDR